jgi:Zn-finger nucleic acid-binding protein
MPADASSLHCPNCGAPADPDAGRCPFCKARLAKISCPSCFALMFDGMAFCPSCGAKRARTQQDLAQALCPACRKPMTSLQIGATQVLECASCDGLWVDAETFEALCADRESQAAALHQMAQRTPVKAAPVKYRPCVRCGKMMNRINFARISGVVVDVCKGHGTYLDPGELHAIVTFVQGGGLDRARARQIEELKEEERRLAEAQYKLARERGRSDAHASAGGISWSFLIGED